MHSVRVAIYDGKSSFCVFVRVSLCVFFLTSRTVFFLSDLCAFYMLFGSCWSCIIGFLFVLTSSSLRVAMSCMLVSFVFLRFVILTYILFFVGVILFYWVSIGGEREVQSGGWVLWQDRYSGFFCGYLLCFTCVRGRESEKASYSTIILPLDCLHFSAAFEIR